MIGPDQKITIPIDENMEGFPPQVDMSNDSKEMTKLMRHMAVEAVTRDAAMAVKWNKLS